MILARKTLEKTIAVLVETVRGHEANQLPQGHACYKLLYNQALAACSEFGNRHGATTEELFAAYPALFVIKAWAQEPAAGQKASSLSFGGPRCVHHRSTRRRRLHVRCLPACFQVVRSISAMNPYQIIAIGRLIFWIGQKLCEPAPPEPSAEEKRRIVEEETRAEELYVERVRFLFTPRGALYYTAWVVVGWIAVVELVGSLFIAAAMYSIGCLSPSTLYSVGCSCSLSEVRRIAMLISALIADAAAVGGYLGIKRYKQQKARRRDLLLGARPTRLKTTPFLDSHFEKRISQATARERKAGAALAGFLRWIVDRQAFDYLAVDLAQRFRRRLQAHPRGSVVLPLFDGYFDRK